MPLEMIQVRFLRSVDRFAAGDTTTVDAKIADCWIRRRLCVPVPGEADAMLLLMPAWRKQRFIGVKLLTIFPDNPRNALPALSGTYLLMSGLTGEPLAVIDARMLTLRRTAAASALASRYLSRPDSERLLLVGTGADRKSTRLNSSHVSESRMPSSA